MRFFHAFRQQVNLFKRIVYRKAGPYGSGNIKEVHNRLGTVMARPYGHTHNNYGCDGRASILVPSPEDLMVFLYTMVNQAGNIYGDYSQAYYFTVTSGGSYMFQYTGTTAPQNLTFDINYLRKEYDKTFSNLQNRDASMPQNKVEEIFAKFLKEKVNIEGLEVYKVTSDSSEKLEYDSGTKTLTKIPCPNI